MCPVCTFAIGAGLGLSRFLGVSDAISGIWIGALILSLSFVGENFFIKRGWKIPHLRVLSLFFWYILTIAPLYFIGIIGHPLNKIFGVDKLIFGIFVGSVAFLMGIFLDKWVRKDKGRQLFDFQKVVFPVLALNLASLLIYIVI